MKRVCALLLVTVFVVAGCGPNSSSTSDTVPSNADKVNVVASNWKWTLDKSTFKVGVPIDFHIEASEGAHAFSINGTKINQSISQGQNAIDKVWTPDKAGTYIIKCAQYCGSGHDNMFTQFTVTN